MKKNVNLCVDVTTLLQKDALPQPGKNYSGTLMVNCEFEYGFVENAPNGTPRRNPCIYQGSCFNVHRSADGTLYPTFHKPNLSVKYDLPDFLRDAAQEMRMVADSLDNGGSDDLVEK